MLILLNYKVWTMIAVRNKQVLAQKRKLLQYNSRKYVEKFSVTDGEDGEILEIMECLATVGVQNPSGFTAYLMFRLTA